MTQNLPPKIKVLRPFYYSEKDHWVIAFKYLDDPETEPWKLYSKDSFYMLAMCKIFIHMLEKYTETCTAYPNLDLDTFCLELQTNHN